MTGPVDIERQHRHCRLIWGALALRTPLRRALQRNRNTAGICPGEDIVIQVESVTVRRDIRRPLRRGMRRSRRIRRSVRRRGFWHTVI
jgi:hypothetical protein